MSVEAIAIVVGIVALAIAVVPVLMVVYATRNLARSINEISANIMKIANGKGDCEKEKSRSEIRFIGPSGKQIGYGKNKKFYGKNGKRGSNKDW